MPIYKMNGKKDGKQKYRVRVNYQDIQGENRQMERVTYGSAEAKELEGKLTDQCKKNKPASRISLWRLYTDYCVAKKSEIRESTLNKTKQILEHHILPTLGKKRLDKLTLPVLQSWKNEINAKPLSITMKKNIYAAFRGMLNHAVKMEFLPKNPLLKIGNFKDPYEIKKEIQYYTSEEFLKFISAAEKQTADSFFEKNYYVFFAIAFYTGMRKGEINALKWSDISGDVIHIRRSISQKLKGEDRETPPKNKSSIRDLQIPQPLKDILAEHYARYKDIDGFTDDWRICGGETCLRDSTIEKRNKLYGKLAGLKHIRIHDFRHSHASLLANEGINIQEIARRLGHSKIEITWNTYSHLYPREEDRALTVLNKVQVHKKPEAA